MNLFKHAIPLLAASLLLISCSGEVESARLASESRASEKVAQGLYNSAVAAEKAGKLGKAKIIRENRPPAPALPRCP